ncbi:uncharacterized protein RJT20DRAFT_63840 [Scheffersomyces xylosifermentans]|uniref:uncharacterized protein n=1 Tax=Scheffersomyces xylosifermentans TaxID=1304137 RepID=UPI00315CC15F
MSAYAALKDHSSVASIFHETGDGEDEILQYDLNSSDEEEGRNLPEERDSQFSSVSQSLVGPTRVLSPLQANPQIVKSKFIPNNENLVVLKDQIVVGLKVNEYIVISGQCELFIQRGAILINQHHYVFADRHSSYKILAPTSQSLPILSSTQVLDRSKGIEDTMTNENAHLFSNEYKSIIVLKNYYSGLEKIGSYYPPFKRIFHCNTISEDNVLDEYESIFSNYSFEIVLKDKGLSALGLEKIWSPSITELINEFKDYIPKIIMVIGNKNSGKSTVSKTLLNSLLQSGHDSVSYLDLDPGQSEYSIPYTLSLTNEKNVVFGLNIPASISDSNDTEDTIQHYFGFSTPIHDPERYTSIIKDLLCQYSKYHKPQGNPLIINTPGWIRGYGKEILIELTEVINPDYLILLSSSLEIEHPDNMEILRDLQYIDVKIMQGIYQSSKYSAAQLRIFNKLSYFHQTAVHPIRFDFNKHILETSPSRISYETVGSPPGFVGINCITILNFDITSNFEYEDILLMIDSTICGIYLVDSEIHYAYSELFYKSAYNDNLPIYLNSSQSGNIFSSEIASKVKFMGLTMVHSIDRSRNYFNLYLPSANAVRIIELLKQGYKLHLVRGEGEVPSAEILNSRILSKKEQDLKTIATKKRKGEHVANELIFPYPYVSFEGKNKIGGVWKIRRNVKRRAHQH